MLRRPRTALLGALLCLAGVAVTGALAYLVPLAHAGDARSLHGFTSLNSPRLDPLLSHVAHLADPLPYGMMGVALAMVALARGRRRLAAAVLVLLVAAPGTSELLKPLLAQQRVAEWLGPAQIGAASWPSGHATASMTLALCAVLAAPAVLRPLAAVGGAAFAIAVSFSLLALHWHFPSDVVGGYFVTGTWVALAVAALRRWPQPGPVRGERFNPVVSLVPVATLLLLAAGAGAALVFARPSLLEHVLVDRRSFAVAAASIAALALLLAGALAYGVSGGRLRVPRAAPPPADPGWRRG